MTNQPHDEQPQEQQKRHHKPKGRAHGEGSVFRRGGNRKKPWVAQVTLENGQQPVIGYFKTQEEAIAAKNKALRDLEIGRLATGPKQTVKQYLEQWLEDVYKHEVRYTTYIRRRILVYKHIIPALGHFQLKALKAQHVQKFYAQKLKEKLSPGYVGNMHDMLNKAMKHAVKWGLVSSNVMVDVTPPKPGEHEVPILTRDQVQELLKKAREHGLSAFITLAIATGMRHGEMLALRWQDINFRERCLYVRRTVTRQGGYGFIEGEPKTRKSKRQIILPEFVLKELEQHRVDLEWAKQKAGATWENNDLVFPNRAGKFLDDGTNLARFYKVLESAGLPRMRVHDLRHNVGTLLMSMGVYPKVVQELLGHSDVAITLGLYGHAVPGMHNAAMDKWKDFLQDGASDKNQEDSVEGQDDTEEI
jgi:integrase